MSEKHTPSPWDEGSHAASDDYDDSGRTQFRRVPERDYQHARHCVNAHDDLLTACLKFLDLWGRAGPQGSAQWEKFDVVVQMTEAAIANAEPPIQENP